MKTKFETAAHFTLAALMMVVGSANASAQDPDRGYFETNHDPIAAWCDNVVRVLDRAQRDANRYVNQYEDFATATRILVQGLRKIDTSNPAVNRTTLTARSVRRGLQLVNVISGSVAGDLKQQRLNYRFLNQYYGFVREVATELDMRYRVPRHGCRDNDRDCWHQCNNNCSHYQEYEQRFVNYVRQQGQIVLDSLTVHGYGMVHPVGSARAFLRALETTAFGMASDLQDESLFGTVYSCEIMDLVNLGERLKDYNNGSGYSLPWPNDMEAVNGSYRDAQDIITGISGCRIRDDYRSDRR